MVSVLRFTFYVLRGHNRVALAEGWLARCACLLLLLATGVMVWGATTHLSHFNDDSYITLTYAKSLAAGEGWRYNGGSEALGTTTPLFALTVAALGWVFPSLSLEWLAVGFSTLCWVASAWLFFLGHRAFGISQGAGAFLGLLLLLHGGWLFGVLGMEAALLLFGLTLATWLAGRSHALAGGLVSALLFLVRPEGLAMVPLVGGWLLWQRRAAWRVALGRFALGATLPLLLWSSYAWLRFGTLLPNSAQAKMGQGIFWPGEPFIERLLTEWLPAHAANYGLSPALSLLWPLSVLGLLYVLRRGGALLLLVGWGGVFLLGYTLLRAPSYWWYMIPILFLLQLLVGLGVVGLVEQPRPLVRRLGVMVGLLFLALSCYYGVQVARAPQSDPRADGYLTVARWLGEHTAPTERVGVVEIGYLGYFTENRIVDLVGLVEPDFTQNGARLDLDRNFWQAEPEYFLYSQTFDFLLLPILQDPRFAARYQVVAEFPRPPAPPLILYQRLSE